MHRTLLKISPCLLSNDLFFHQAEEFRTAIQMLLEWLSEAEQTLRFRGVLPEEAETLQALLHTHRDFMGTVEDKRTDVNKAAGMGESILTVCHPDSITTIKHWITIIRARFEEVRRRGRGLGFLFLFRRWTIFVLQI